MQIHELDTYMGTPSATDFMAVDDGTETFKIPLPSVGVSTPMTAEEAEAGTVTDPRVISPSVFKSSVLDIFYPVGSYFETSDTSFDPNTAWGGTWEKEVAGQVHVSAGGTYYVSGANINTSDGGERTHTLTINEMPAHNHGLALSGGSTTGSYMTYTYGAEKKLYSGTEFVANTGGGQAHNIMQPYIVVNRWHRTA